MSCQSVSFKRNENAKKCKSFLENGTEKYVLKNINK